MCNGFAKTWWWRNFVIHWIPGGDLAFLLHIMCHSKYRIYRAIKSPFYCWKYFQFINKLMERAFYLPRGKWWGPIWLEDGVDPSNRKSMNLLERLSALLKTLRQNSFDFDERMDPYILFLYPIFEVASLSTLRPVCQIIMTGSMHIWGEDLKRLSLCYLFVDANVIHTYRVSWNWNGKYRRKINKYIIS